MQDDGIDQGDVISVIRVTGINDDAFSARTGLLDG